MSEERTLLELAACLKSTKKKDRVKGLNEVSTFILQENIVRHLTKCSRKQLNGTCWDILFVHVNDAIMGEIERGCFSGKFLINMTESLSSVVLKAHGLIRAKSLVSAVLSAFETQANLPAELGKVYFELASGHLLEMPKYRAELRHEHWTDLVNMCMLQYNDPRPGTSSLKFLELLCKVITSGVNYSLTFEALLNLLPFFTNILLSDIPPSASFEWNLLLAVNTSLLALVADARHKVVAFTEAVFEPVIRMYQSGSDTIVLIFHFLGIAMNVHHPQGAGCDDPQYYAQDDNLWKEILPKILQLCEREVCDLLRSGAGSLISDEFMTLFVDISHVMSLIRTSTPKSTPDEEVDYSALTCTARKRKSVDCFYPTQKRAKLVSACTSLSNVLADMSLKDYWFWLTYLAKLLERHPVAVKRDYEKIVRVVSNLSSDRCSLGPLIKCAELLFRNGPENGLSDLWTPCFESLARAVMKDNADDQHRMLQILIKNHVKDKASFLKICRNLPCTAESMRTSATLIRMGATITEEERCLLLRWATSSICHPVETAELVLALLFKEFPFAKEQLKKSTDFTEIYSILTLNEEAVDSSEQFEEPQLKSIYAGVADCLLEIISHRPQSHTRGFESLVEDAYLIEIILRISSNVLREEGLHSKLLTLVQPLFEQFMLDCECEIRAKKPFRVEIISRLFALEVHPSLENLIRSLTSDSFSEMLVCLIKAPTTKDSGCCEYQAKLLHGFTSQFTRLISSLKQPDLEKMFSFDDRASLKHRLRILELLCQIRNTSKLVGLLDEFTTDLSNFRVRMLLQLIYSVTEQREKSSSDLTQCLKTLHSICKQRYFDNSSLYLCLVIIRNMVPSIGNHGDSSTHDIFVTLVDGIKTNLAKRKGTVRNLDIIFIEILSQACNFPPLARKNWGSSDTRMVEDVLNYVNSCSIFVRLTAARGVGKVFSSHSSQEIMQRLRRQLSRPPVHQDDFGKMAVASSSLMALAYALNASSETRFSAAYATIDIIHSQNFSYELIACFLGLLSRLFGCGDAAKYFGRHFKDLLLEWLGCGNLLRDFPYPIVKCKNTVHFFHEYGDVIGAVCFISRKDDMLDEMASALNSSLAEILEKAFPVIACMTNGKLPAKLNDFISNEKQQLICTENIGKIAYTMLRESSVNQRLSVFDQVIESARAVQQTLLLFEEDLVESVTEEDVLDSLSQYSGFVRKYVDATVDSCRESFDVNIFVLRDTISVILRFLSGKHSLKALEIACGLIQHIIDRYVGPHKAEIIALLPGVVNVLVAVSGKCDSRPAVDLLRYLISKKEEFAEAFSRLDPLPDDEVFAGLVDLDEDIGLREELKRFALVDSARGRRVGGLIRLLRALENHKQELSELYEEARTVQGVSEGTLLHDVLQQLVSLCSHKDEAVRTEASKCLGELGPTDLNTLVLKHEENEGSSYIPVEHRLVDSSLVFLGHIIQTESLAVKKVACKALYRVLRFEGNASQCSRFCAPFCSQNTPRELVFSAKNTKGPLLDEWLPTQKISHDLWVKQLTTALLETLRDCDGLSDVLQEMCDTHAPFAQQLLPLVLGIVVEVGDPLLIENITQNMNDFFSSHISGHMNLELKSVATLVEAVDYLRRWNFRRGNYGASLNDRKTAMQLDYLTVAEAAGNCGAHFTSMMYAELWYEDQKTDYLSKKPGKWRVSVDDLPECRNTLSRVMRSGFASIGVLDGLHGCGLSHFADPVERITHLEQIGRWDMCLVMHDVKRNSEGVKKGLFKYDLPFTLTSLPGVSDNQLACAAKLGDWNLVPLAGAQPSFHLHHYSALKALHHRDMTSMMDEINKATGIVLKRISENKMESPQNLYESLAHLQCLKQLRDVENSGSLGQLRGKWELQDTLKPSEFSLLAEVLEVRCVIIKELHQEPDLLAEQYLRFCKLARRAGENDIALRNILQLNQLINAREDLQLQGQMEEARYFWENGVHENGTFLMTRLLKNLEISRRNDLYAKCLQMYGKWMVERKVENPHDVIEKYFKTSLHVAKNEGNKLEAYAAMAKLADENYIQMKEYMESPNFELSKLNLQQRIHSLQNDQRNVRAKKEGENDLREVKFLQQEAGNFLSLAVRYYVLSLQSGEKYDYFVFRLISLWLSNAETVSEEEIAKIPSYKFISLLPQIIPRMHGDKILTRTVQRILNEHPYHTLPFLFALKNSYADQQYMGQTTKEPTQRMRAAYNMIRAAQKKHSVMIDEMERFTAALIHLSNIETPKPPRPQVINIEPSAPLAMLHNLNTVMMPSIELPVQRNLRYDNIIGIARFQNSYELVGGINCPKKIECLGTDGKTRILLVKGQDDLRQDAVMQQVFTVINSLLARNEETARHKLAMRTYRVVPLSQLSGIIGWCENTQPLGVYLVGRNNSGGAHERFRPNDMKSSEARQTLGAMNQDPDERLSRFLKICQRFQPVFHYFFLEKFPSAGMAFDRRLAYTRSVATSSMIGYILGLGDRHVMNILIDNVTAEVIHIDFGIAFDQGQTLKVPETVPFRLTRDIVDGMGLTGVDGVFRSCCKRTMEVLRQNKDTIITLLEVLLYDPLNTWVMNPTPSSSVLDRPVDNVNAMAERALSRVALKLQGLDKGVVTSVEGQVNGLIQQAMDASRLSRIFHGWQPYV